VEVAWVETALAGHLEMMAAGVVAAEAARFLELSFL
jgi:hypothetical protein